MDKEKIMIMRLQDNLSTIRKLGGWTTQELGDKIGVTKQTISNLENKKSTMTKLQYIGLRSVLDSEANSSSEYAPLLKLALEKLLDAELSADEQANYEEKMKTAAAAISGGATALSVTRNFGLEDTVNALTGSVIAGGVAAVGVALGSAIPLGMVAGVGTAKWLEKLLKKEN